MNDEQVQFTSGGSGGAGGRCSYGTGAQKHVRPRILSGPLYNPPDAPTAHGHNDDSAALFRDDTPPPTRASAGDEPASFVTSGHEATTM